MTTLLATQSRKKSRVADLLPPGQTKLADAINREKADPIISNLKSHSFQALTALLLREEGFQNVEINLDVPLSEE